MLKPSYSNYTIDTHLFKTIVILIDTREQENKHITEYFDKKGIAYKSQKLDFGDYSLLLPKNEQYGISYDMQLDFAVERKHNLEELSGNFAQDRDRIEHEMWRGNGKMVFIIENGSLDKILNHEYNTNYNEKSFLATLIAFNHRYNTPFYFVEKENSGQMIYGFLLYKLREDLKKGE
jgi:hypothetical protein